MLLDQVKTEWALCFDADERLVGELPDLTADGYRFRLFDGYMSKDREEPYSTGKLADLPRYWGPEYRDILMLFRCKQAIYHGPDRREPVLIGAVCNADITVKHFGKCISTDQWEETCEYYSTHWPEPYKSKWEGRKGKSIHTDSDFGRPLFRWADVAANGVKL